MRKRLLPVLLLVALSLVAGCSGEPPTSDTPGKQAAPNTTDRSTSK
ncbi:MAG: hypothetical protein SFU56_09185 [Capsulimonadales bacterium]|nr:hypothetical protein [Capsulimonadales bacterium]